VATPKLAVRKPGAWILLVVAAKAAMGAWVLHAGFTHVSDDDYARVVIAQLFAHAPKLDPSGTSWLPFPFWTVGGLMMLAGRSLAVAQVVAFGLGVLGAALVYVALRAAGVAPWRAAAGTMLGMATPWNAWLGVATVPESLTAALVACGAILLPVPRARPWAAAGLLAAALSRYEAWPVCALFAVVCAWSAVREGRAGDRAWRREACSAAVAALGPLAWMAWNAHVHDGALHFLRRVATYRSAMMPEHDTHALQTLISFPRALFTGAPEIAPIAALGAFALSRPATRKRWALPLASVAVLLAFLVYGDWSDGAPTHHAERALAAAWVILAAFGVDGAAELGRAWVWGRPKREAWIAAAVVCLLLPWSLTIGGRLADAPGTRTEEQRRDQLALGRALAARHAQGFDVVPCAYEHFATLAAFGAPEDATILPASHDRMTGECPHIVLRP
jgi:hypothetical protein